MQDKSDSGKWPETVKCMNCGRWFPATCGVCQREAIFNGYAEIEILTDKFIFIKKSLRGDERWFFCPVGFSNDWTMVDDALAENLLEHILSQSKDKHDQ